MFGSFMGLGFSEVLLICAIGLLLFGNKLPALARSLGKTLAVFRSEVRGVDDEVGRPLR
jgi:sec-independent protein translocase protein TatA